MEGQVDAIHKNTSTRLNILHTQHHSSGTEMVSYVFSVAIVDISRVDISRTSADWFGNC